MFEHEEIDESESVEKAARKKLRTLGAVDHVTRRRRLYAYLARRGYDIDDINRALSAVLANDGESPDQSLGIE